MTSSRKRLLALAVGVTAFVAPATVAHSAWTTTTATQLSVTTDAAVPLPAPNKPTCVWNGSAVTLSWNAISGAVWYPVHQGGVALPLATPVSTSVTLIETQMGLPVQGSRYDLTVRAFNGATSPDSPSVQVQFLGKRCV